MSTDGPNADIAGANICLAQNFSKLPRPAHAPYLRPIGNKEEGCL